MNNRILPEGLSLNDFEDAVKELQAAIGKDWVYTEETDLNLYRDPYSPFSGEPEDPVPSLVVAPKTREEVQAVVRIANRFKIPLWTVSTGKNLGYGGAAPRTRGMMTLDLKRMNRIIEVNEKHGYALVEPGVSYFDLYRYIQEKGYKLWLDVPSPGWSSVLANTLEHGAGYTPYGDHYAQQCGMEVVLPDGDVLRTGMGAMPNTETWQQFRYGFGPHIDGLFSQSNLGIVTKLGIWLMPEPPAFRSGYITFDKPEDIVLLIDTLRPLRQSGVVANTATIMTGMMDLMFEPKTQKLFHDPSLPPDPKLIMTLLKERKLGYWNNRIAVYGTKKVVDAKWEEIQDAHANIAGVGYLTDFFETPYDHSTFDFRAKLHAGVPSMSEFAHMGKLQGHMFFSPSIPFDGETVWEQIQFFDNIYREYGMRYFGGPYISTSNRTLIGTIGLPTFRGDRAKNAVIRQIMTRIIDEAAAKGWGEYRTPIYYMDQVMNTYSYNNYALRRFHETLKDALDPNGILSPGKSGIWPKSSREMSV